MSTLFNQDFFIKKYVQQLNAHTKTTGIVYDEAGVLADLQSQGKTALDLYNEVGMKYGIGPSLLTDTAVYVSNKLVQLQREDPNGNWTVDSLNAAFKASGMSLLEHFEQYGNKEAISFTTLFNSEEYLINKTKQVYGVVNAENRQATLDAITDAGMSVWDHFMQYGYKEDVDPSARFDLSKYLDDKLAQMQKTNSAYSMDNLKADLDACGLNALTHYADYGAGEGLRPTGKYTPYQFSIDATHKGYIMNMPNVTLDMFKTTFTEGLDGKHTYTGITGSSIIDAEKSYAAKLGDTKDDNMCWAATAANMLQASGWVHDMAQFAPTPTASGEDRIFQAFVDNFLYGDKRGGYTNSGINWFASGVYGPTDSPESDRPVPNSGNYLNKKLGDYLSISTDKLGVTDMNKMAATLDTGGSVGMDFSFSKTATSEGGAHAVTTWGYTVDMSFAPNNPNYYTGLIISDSDNTRWHDDRTATLNSMQYLNVKWDATANAYTFSIGSIGCTIESMTYLQGNPDFLIA